MKKGRPPFQPRWSNRKALRVGFLLGRGRQAPDIAIELADGTTAATIRMMRGWAGLKEFGKARGATSAVVQLTSAQARLLRKRAKQQGLTTEEWLRRVASAAIEDDMFEAIVDD